ncbi:MAG: diguanylate cyclase [Acidobacteria bacterium]|nr:diguanylate cyclase [Acidobacteriota bacterium]
MVLVDFFAALAILLLALWVFRRDARARRRAEEALARVSRENELILSAAGDGIYRIDSQGSIIFLNPAASRMLGWSLPEIEGQNAHELFHHSRADGSPFSTSECPIFSTSRDGSVRHVPADLFWRKDGSSFDVEYISAPILEGDTPNGAVVTFRDISARRETELALQDANEKLSAWVHELHQRTSEITQLGELGELLHTCVNAEEAYPIIARACEKLFPEETGALCVLAASRNLADAVAVWGDSGHGERVFPPEQCWALRRGRIHLIDGPKAGPLCQHVTETPAGGSICVPMMAQGEAMGILHLQRASEGAGWSDSKQKLAVTVADHVGLALANIQLRESLRIQSIRDSLTGLFNRRYMEESLERELRRAARQHRPLGIIMLDVDYFKRFNDTFGHEAGDTLLREVGQFLQSRTRGEDIACRYGGEEFTLILPDATMDITRQRAEQIRNEVRHLNLNHRGNPLGSISVSAGVAVFPRHGMEVADLLRSADRALYEAKSEGRDCVRLAVTVEA